MLHINIKDVSIKKCMHFFKKIDSHTIDINILKNNDNNNFRKFFSSCFIMKILGYYTVYN